MDERNLDTIKETGCASRKTADIEAISKEADPKADTSSDPKEGIKTDTQAPAEKIVVISVGDVNGISLEVLFNALGSLRGLTTYICIDKELFLDALTLYEERTKKVLFDADIIDDFIFIPPSLEGLCALPRCELIASDVNSGYTKLKVPSIKVGEVDKAMGLYSFASFLTALCLADRLQDEGNGSVSLLTLSVTKASWKLADIPYAGHTQMLDDYYREELDSGLGGKRGIMLLGCKELFVGLLTHHIPLREVVPAISKMDVKAFLLDFYKKFYEVFPAELEQDASKHIVLTGINPHCGDDGMIGNEDAKLFVAASEANKELGGEVFCVMPTDAAFNPYALKHCNVIIAAYHDAGLAPLKALYFEESVNITLGLPIFRISVSHGSAHDIAYKGLASSKSFVNCVKIIRERG